RPKERAWPRPMLPVYAKLDRYRRFESGSSVAVEAGGEGHGTLAAPRGGALGRRGRGAGGTEGFASLVPPVATISTVLDDAGGAGGAARALSAVALPTTTDDVVGGDSRAAGVCPRRSFKNPTTVAAVTAPVASTASAVIRRLRPGRE